MLTWSNAEGNNLLIKFLSVHLIISDEMDFSTFEKKNLMMEKDFSWEVEKEAMGWERAVGCKKRLLLPLVRGRYPC